MSDKSLVGPVLLGAALAGATGLCLYLLLSNQEKKVSNSQNPEQITLEIWVESKDIGVLLGRQGSNLREIQSKSNTRIWFLDTNSVNQTKCKFFIRGTPDDAQFAEMLIQQTISMQPKLEKCIVRIPKIAESTLLGKNGEKKKRLEVKSRCKMEINSNGGSDADELCIILKGTRHQIELGKKLIEETIEEHRYIYNKINKKSEQQALSYDQPLFLKYQDQGEDEVEAGPGNVGQETLRCSGSDQLVQVYVSTVANPGRFWVQNVGPSSIELDKLTENMTQYYSRKENQLFHRLDSVCPGEIVVSMYSSDSSFYRARVVSYNLDEYDVSQSTVDLDFVDYGDCEVKPISEVYEIRPEYLKLNFQAILCRLSRVKPVNGSEWCDESVDQFESLSCCALWKPIYAKIVTPPTNNNRGDETAGDNIDPVVIELYTLQGESNISEELVKQGLARIVR